MGKRGQGYGLKDAGIPGWAGDHRSTRPSRYLVFLFGFPYSTSRSTALRTGMWAFLMRSSATLLLKLVPVVVSGVQTLTMSNSKTELTEAHRREKGGVALSDMPLVCR